jgi:F420H(2)-dependent quinone reductase
VRDHPLSLRLGWKVHRVLDRLSGGRLGARVDGIPVLWLSTLGRKTRAVRANPPYYLDDGPNLVVVASNAGLDADPSWWLNLQAHPETTARTGCRVHRVRAHEATPEERARLWQRLIELYPGYGTYQAGTTRAIPVVILELRAGG